MREANRNGKAQTFITKIDIVQKRSLMYYQVQKSRSFLKIYVALPTMVAGCRGMFELWIHILLTNNCDGIIEDVVLDFCNLLINFLFSTKRCWLTWDLQESWRKVSILRVWVNGPS